jgi:ribosome-binding protein aMBF1 (putative translation factor)
MKAKSVVKSNKANNSNVVLKWKTADQVFKKSSSNREFKTAYKAETERIAIARSLREARIKRDLTQAELAKQTAMPQSAIARLESGNHSVSFETLSRVAHALGKEIKIV